MTYTVHVQRLDPTLADLRLEFADVPPGVEIRGRLMGPRCPGVSTVEIAYHLRPLGPGVCQVLIPEPSLWTPETPHLYEGPAELYQDGVKVGTLPLSIALRRS